jgi:hypothetical protein
MQEGRQVTSAGNSERAAIWLPGQPTATEDSCLVGRFVHSPEPVSSLPQLFEGGWLRIRV